MVKAAFMPFSSHEGSGMQQPSVLLGTRSWLQAAPAQLVSMRIWLGEGKGSRMQLQAHPPSGAVGSRACPALDLPTQQVSSA